MSTRHLVDPETLPILELLPVSDMTRENLNDVRSQSLVAPDSIPDGVLMPEIVFTKGRDGAPDVQLLVYNPPSAKPNRGAILHIHGGGMVLGSADMNIVSCSTIALQHDCVIVSVEYRLAPETTFPGPQEDCYAGLEWLIAHAVELTIDLSNVHVMGESAGGGLAAALALMVRDRGVHNLAGQILIYPMIDHRVGGPSDPYNNPVTGEFIWTKSRNQFGWNCLKGNYDLNDARIGWFSPSRADDLAKLPATYIMVGALDLFLDENLDYARGLVAAGVPCELHVYPGAIHGFNMFPMATVSQQANRDMMEAIGRMLVAKKN